MTAAGTELSAAQARPAHWGGVFAMTLCVFTLIASEFMPVSLLTPMAAGLGVTEGMAGQGIAISGAFAVAASLFTARLAGGMDRRTLLLALTAVMGLSGAVIALAPSYPVYMAGRALIGVVVGGFWSMSAATAMRLVPPAQGPRALAVFNGGNALATVVAAPLGAYLGSAIGWRGAFFCLVPVALIAFAWQWISLPPMRVERRQAGEGGVLRLLRRRVVALGMLGVGVFFMGQFTLFTYVRPFLETALRADAATVTLVLLVIGVAGFSRPGLVGRGPRPGFFATLAAHARPGGGLMVAVIQLSIALGSTAGGLLFDRGGYQGTFAAAAALLLAAAFLVFLTSCSDAAQAA